MVSNKLKYRFDKFISLTPLNTVRYDQLQRIQRSRSVVEDRTTMYPNFRDGIYDQLLALSI